MDQNRKDRQGMQSSYSGMERSDASWESALEHDRMSRERMRGSESGKNLGSTSDRAMFSDSDSAESRSSMESSDSRYSSMRGRGESGERNSGSSERGSNNSGGITNRPLDQEQCEQERLPERGRSSSDR